MKLVVNASEAPALYGDLTGVALDPVVRHLMYEPECDAILWLVTVSSG